jgi:hypothetical protein
MANEYGQTFASKQFVDLARSRVLVKPCIIEGFAAPFRAKTEITETTSTGAKGSIVGSSRQRYASERVKVENRINRWMERWSEK